MVQFATGEVAKHQNGLLNDRKGPLKNRALTIIIGFDCPLHFPRAHFTFLLGYYKQHMYSMDNWGPIIVLFAPFPL